jgi:mono/diheme cytochrome c family protein
MTWRIIVGTISVVVTMVLLGYVAVTEQDRMASFSAAYAARDIENGGLMFDALCAECHGPQGLGVPGRGPALNSADLFDGTRTQEALFAGSVESYVRLTISAGRPRMSEWARQQGFVEPMPTWGEEYGGPLRPDQLNALTMYVMNWALEHVDGTPQPGVVGVGTDITQELPPGDPVRGEELATSQGCTACHVVGAVGPSWLAGADPSGVGIGARAELRVNEPGYAGAATDGFGYLFESIVLPDAYIVQPASQYAPAGTSLMPHTYDVTLDAQMVADLIAYMDSLR